MHTHPTVTVASSNTDIQNKTPRAITGPRVVLFASSSLSLAEAPLPFSKLAGLKKVMGVVDLKACVVVAEMVLKQY